MNILKDSVCIILLLSGILKLIYIKYTVSTITLIDLFPSKISKYIGYLLPLLEISMAVLLYEINEKLVYVFIIGYLMFFIIINLKFIYQDKKCCCYGRLIKSKLGLGGVIHYTYWLMVIIIDILVQKDYVNINFYSIILTLFLVSNSLIIRRLVEVTY